MPGRCGRIVLLMGSSENSYRETGPTFNRDLWRGVVFGDYFADGRSSLRLLARDTEEALVILSSVWKKVLHAFLASPKEFDLELKRAAARVDQIPRK